MLPSTISGSDFEEIKNEPIFDHLNELIKHDNLKELKKRVEEMKYKMALFDEKKNEFIENLLNHLPEQFSEKHKDAFHICFTLDVPGPLLCKLQIENYYLNCPEVCDEKQQITFFLRKRKDHFPINKILNLTSENVVKLSVLFKELNYFPSREHELINENELISQNTKAKTAGKQIHDDMKSFLHLFEQAVKKAKEINLIENSDKYDTSLLARTIEKIDYYILLSGLMKVGKSTIINSITGREVIPQREAPTTVIPTVISHKAWKGNLTTEERITKARLILPKFEMFNEMLNIIKQNITVVPSDKSKFAKKIENNEIPEFLRKTEGTIIEIYDLLVILNDMIRIIYEAENSNQLPKKEFLKKFQCVKDLPKVKIEFHSSFLPYFGKVHLIDTAGANENSMKDDLTTLLQQLYEQASCNVFICDPNHIKSENNMGLFSDLKKVQESLLSRVIVVVNRIDTDDKYTTITNEVTKQDLKIDEQIDLFKEAYETYRKEKTSFVAELIEKQVNMVIDKNSIIPYCAVHSFYGTYWDLNMNYYKELDNLPIIHNDSKHKWFNKIVSGFGEYFMKTLVRVENIKDETKRKKKRSKLLQEMTEWVKECTIKGGKDYLYNTLIEKTVSHAAPEVFYNCLINMDQKIVYLSKTACDKHEMLTKTKKELNEKLDCLQKIKKEVENANEKCGGLVDTMVDEFVTKINDVNLPNEESFFSKFDKETERNGNDLNNALEEIVKKLKSSIFNLESNNEYIKIFKTTMDIKELFHKLITEKEVTIKKEKEVFATIKNRLIDLSNGFLKQFIDVCEPIFYKYYGQQKAKLFTGIKDNIKDIKDRFRKEFEILELEPKKDIFSASFFIKEYEYQLQETKNIEKRFKWWFIIPLIFSPYEDLATSEITGTQFRKWFYECISKFLFKCKEKFVITFKEEADCLRKEKLNLLVQEIEEKKSLIERTIKELEEKEKHQKNIREFLNHYYFDLIKKAENISQQLKDNFPNVISEIEKRNIESHSVRKASTLEKHVKILIQQAESLKQQQEINNSSLESLQ